MWMDDIKKFFPLNSICIWKIGQLNINFTKTDVNYEFNGWTSLRNSLI